jgi:hypothetical protein
METLPLSLIATYGGFALTAGMGFKLVRELGSAWLNRNGDHAQFLELVVNGKDYSVDLNTISNGGSEKIRAALLEAERCN